MTTREKMIEFRTDHNLSIPDMAKRCRISSYLLQLLEDGATTTPKLVPQIASEYGLSELEAEELMPEHMRPHGDDYEPDRYVVNMPTSKSVIDKLPDFLWMRHARKSGRKPSKRCVDEETVVSRRKE